MEVNAYIAISIGIWGITFFSAELFSILANSHKFNKITLIVFSIGGIILLTPPIFLEFKPSLETETISVTSIKESSTYKDITSVTYLDTNGEETTVSPVKEIYYSPDYKTHLEKQTEKFWFLYQYRYILYIKTE